MPMSVPVAPTSSQKQWRHLSYGMFIHFGMKTFAGDARGEASLPADRFAPEHLDCRQWMSVMHDAHMRYAVLTAKHHDGFCLWPTKLTQYSVAGSSGHQDVVGEFIEACKWAGMRPGLYYSLLDRNCPFYDDDVAYAQYVQEQVGELLKAYGPLVELWFDGAWDKDSPRRAWDYDPMADGPVDESAANGARWRWAELYQHIHRLQADCLVMYNSGPHRPGAVCAWPIDVRTGVHFDFVHKGEVCRPPETNVFSVPGQGHVHLPIEFCASLNQDWFWSARSYSHPNARTIAGWYKRAQVFDGNLLLNAGPDRRGLIPDYHREYLRAAKQLMGRA